MGSILIREFSSNEMGNSYNLLVVSYTTVGYGKIFDLDGNVLF